MYVSWADPISLALSATAVKLVYWLESIGIELQA